MANIKIWHNTRCSKSRNAFKLLEDKNLDFEVVEYLKVVPSKDELKLVLSQLNISAKELLRTGEAVYKELGLKDVSDEEKLIDMMLENPKLIERPIIVKNGKAVIARPIENLEELLNQ
ncbi:MAG: arsenate reductase (glutaredoxin) [Sulfurovum sp.]|jgi:arsenate reductase|nr:MAG: Arsenate reductase [Arcobacter lacus]